MFETSMLYRLQLECKECILCNCYSNKIHLLTFHSYITLIIEAHVSKVQSRLPRRRSTSCNEQLRRPQDRGAGWRLHCSCVLPSRTSSALAPEWGCPGAPQGLLQPRLRPTCYLLTRPQPRALRGVRHPLRDGERVGGVATVRPETTRRKQLSAIIIIIK